MAEGEADVGDGFGVWAEDADEGLAGFLEGDGLLDAGVRKEGEGLGG